MKPKSKLLSLLLTICLVVGLMPTAAFAAGTDTGKAIQLVDSGTAANIGGGQADNIYFGTYQQSSDGSGGYNTTRSSGGCWKMQMDSCSCFPTRTWMYFSITRIVKASHGKRAPCAPGSTGTVRSKIPAAAAGLTIQAIILSVPLFRRKSRRLSRIQPLSMTITQLMAQRAATTPPIKSSFCRLRKRRTAAILPITAAVLRPIQPM